MLSSNIEIRQIKNVNLKGGIVIDGFPSIGITNAIACECLIRSLKTELVAVITSDSFPALSVINNGRPSFPARVYANEELNFAIFVSEINPDQSMFYPISRLILQWSIENQCDMILSAAGIAAEEVEHVGLDLISNPQTKNGNSVAAEIDRSIFAAASTKRALKKATDCGIPCMLNGWVSGIPAVLLNEAAWKDYDVIVLLAKALKDIPDFRAAAAIVEEINKLAPGLSCNLSTLLNEAEGIEKTLKNLRIDQINSGIYG